jgi:hypothetical protein
MISGKHLQCGTNRELTFNAFFSRVGSSLYIAARARESSTWSSNTCCQSPLTEQRIDLRVATNEVLEAFAHCAACLLYTLTLPTKA